MVDWTTRISFGIFVVSFYPFSSEINAIDF